MLHSGCPTICVLPIICNYIHVMEISVPMIPVIFSILPRRFVHRIPMLAWRLIYVRESSWRLPQTITRIPVGTTRCQAAWMLGRRLDATDCPSSCPRMGRRCPAGRLGFAIDLTYRPEKSPRHPVLQKYENYDRWPS